MEHGVPLEERIRASAVCVCELPQPIGRALLCVRMRDPSSRIARLFPPGGGVEPGESPREAALREAFEETGYRLAIGERACVARYPYTWDGTPRAITTHFFRTELIGDPAAPAPVNDASYNEGVVWLPLADLDRELGFVPAIHEAVRSLI